LHTNGDIFYVFGVFFYLYKIFLVSLLEYENVPWETNVTTLPHRLTCCVLWLFITQSNNLNHCQLWSKLDVGAQ